VDKLMVPRKDVKISDPLQDVHVQSRILWHAEKVFIVCIAFFRIFIAIVHGLLE
jgi:membrane-associated PAP2 superfamily phosphatase